MRKLFVLLMVVAMFAMSGLAMAQAEVACGNLSAEDCSIITQSAAAQAALTSATFDFTLNIDAGGQSIPLTGDGSFAVDPSVLTSIDASTFASDPTAAIGALGGVLKGFNGELNINAMAMIDLNLLLVDGVGYFNFASVAPLLGGPESLSAMGLPADWAGLDLVGAIEMLAPMLSSTDMSSTEVDPASQQAILEAVTKNVVITRGADEAGQAVFVTSFDFGALLQNEAFLGIVMAQAAPGQELTEEQLQQVLPMLQSVGNGITFSATQKIDLSTFYVTNIGFNFSLDGAALTAVTGESVENVTVSGALNYADFNAAPAVAAPAGAPVATIMDLMGMLGGAGSF